MPPGSGQKFRCSWEAGSKDTQPGPQISKDWVSATRDGGAGLREPPPGHGNPSDLRPAVADFGRRSSPSEPTPPPHVSDSLTVSRQILE